MLKKIFILFLLFALCRTKPQFQWSQSQAQEVSSQLKSCVPVTPIAPGTDYLNALHPPEKKENKLNVVKSYDAPVKQSSVVQVLIEKEPNGNVSMSCDFPGIGNLKVPIDFSQHGLIIINHNLSLTVMGTPTDIYVRVKATLLGDKLMQLQWKRVQNFFLDFEFPNFLFHGCGRILGPEFQMAFIFSQQTTLDPAYAAKIVPILQTYGISAE